MGSIDCLQWAVLGPGSLQSSRSPAATHGAFQTRSLCSPLTDTKVSSMIIALVSGELQPQVLEESKEEVSPARSHRQFAPFYAF